MIMLSTEIFNSYQYNWNYLSFHRKTNDLLGLSAVTSTFLVDIL